MMIRNSGRASHTKREIRGCIDLGSSNFRLLVVDGAFPEDWRRSAGELEIISSREMKRYVGWGEDLARTGSVSPALVARAALALGELIAASRELGCAAPLIVATNTLRESGNASGIRAALEEASGMPIRVLSQREEAELGYIGASFFWGREEPLCLIDLGGTSTEISWGRGVSFEGYEGIPYGTHRVRLLLGGGGASRVSALLRERLEKMGLFGAPQPAGVYPLPRFLGDSTMLMTGGTAVSLAVFHRYMHERSPSFEELSRITRGDVALARRRLAGILRARLERTVPIDRDRMRLFPAGLVLIDALVRAARVESFGVTARDLRWGAVLTEGTGI